MSQNPETNPDTNPDDTPSDDTRPHDTAPTTRIPSYEPPARSTAEAQPTTTGATSMTATLTRDDVAVAPPVRRQMRMRTLVAGIVLLAIAVLSIINLTTSIDFRLGTVVLALMIGCGVLLIVGASRRE